MNRKLILAMAFGVVGGVAHADALTDQLVAEFQASGHTFIEVKTSATQIKVEATRGTTKTEVVVDRATGDVLKREVEAAEPSDMIRTGVTVRDRGNRTFTGGRSRGDDDDRDDDDRRADASDDDNDDSGRGRGRGDDDRDDRDDRDDGDDRDDSDRADSSDDSDDSGRGRGRGRGGDDDRDDHDSDDD